MTERNTGSLNLIEQAVLNRISQGEIKGKIHQLAMPYKELMAYYRCAMMQVETKFNVLNEELSLQYDRNPIETIKTRLKTPESIANKLIKKQVPLTAESIEENISDVAGVRVICSFQSDIYMLADALLKQDDITLLKRKDYIAHPKENGYRSLHLIVQIPIHLHDQKKLMRVEVQFRTISMDWWASLEHKIRYLDAIKALCLAIRLNQGRRVGENAIIGQLRVIFAKISLEKLEPDLVIMDEFQRFRYLLKADPESEVGMLTTKFFHAKDVRMLMLSATPYKMYSTPEEIDETRIDEHYSEFLSVMGFLNEDDQSKEHFLTVWRDYSVRLRELTLGDTSIIAAKSAAEDAMYQTVCRTERITENRNADIIDDSDVHIPLEVLEQDIRSYVQAQQLLDSIGANMHVPVDYIKSSPYWTGRSVSSS